MRSEASGRRATEAAARERLRTKALVAWAMEQRAHRKLRRIAAQFEDELEALQLAAVAEATLAGGGTDDTLFP